MKYTQYEFFIIPFYKSVEGKPSNSRVARTLEDGKCAFTYIIYVDDDEENMIHVFHNQFFYTSFSPQKRLLYVFV